MRMNDNDIWYRRLGCLFCCLSAGVTITTIVLLVSLVGIAP